MNRRYNTVQLSKNQLLAIAKLLGGLIGLFVVIGIVAGLFSIGTLKGAKDKLTLAKDYLTQVSNNPSALLSSTGRSEDVTILDKAINLSNQAASAISGSSSLTILRFFPIIGTQRDGILSLASNAVVASKTARDLLGDVDSLARTSQISNGHVPLLPLAQLAIKTQKAQGEFQQLIQNPRGLIGPIYSARIKFNAAAVKVANRLENASQDLLAAQEFMGSLGTRNYLVIGENNAEMRDQGMALSYSTVQFSNGTFSTGPNQDTGNIEPTKPIDIAIPRGTEKIFGGLTPTQLWQSTNATADFPWSAQVMAKMYEQAAGTHVDGVIALDVPALANLLSVTGPITVPGIGQTITSSNVGDILLNQLYEAAPTPNQQQARRDEVANVASTIMSQLRNSSGSDLVHFANALAKSAAGGHLMLWSSNKQEEDIFVKTGLGGDISYTDPQRTIHVAVENATATKLDYYIHPTIDTSIDLTRTGTAQITTTVAVDNQAPVGAKPSYQLGPDNINSFTPGQYVCRIYFWGPSVGNQPASVSESGLRLNQIPLSVQAGQSGFVSFRTSIANAVRNGRFDLRFVPQPRLFPDLLNVKLAAQGWKVSGPAKESLTLDKTIILDWKISHN